MKKLLQINICVNLKSTGVIVEQLAMLARKNGFETFAAGVEVCYPSCSEVFVIPNNTSRFVHRMRARFLNGQGLGSQHETERLLRWIEKVQPDIIHLHNLHCAYLNYPLLFDFLKSFGKPVVWTLHDCWPFTGHCTHFEAASCNKWQSHCDDCPLIPCLSLDRSRQNFLKKRQYFTALPNLTLVPISTWMSEKLSFSFLKEQKRQTIINGIDLSCFRPYDKKNVRAELGICEEDFVVFAAASTWTDDKGLQEIVRLSKNPDFKLVVLGVQSSQAKLFSNNTFTRPLVLDKSLLAKYYAAADVFVNPTYNDSFSNVNMESLACGTPVVCYRSGGAPDTLSSQTGIVVPRGDYEALEKAIYLIRNKEFVVTEGDCRKWVEANFDKDKNFEQYIQLYLSLLS